MTNLAKLWQTAQVAEPLGFDSEQINSSVGVICLRANTPTIISLNPAEDFELNTDIINSWKLIFQNAEDEILGDIPYAELLPKLQPYILDQQNGSVLVQALSVDELLDLVG